MDRREFDILIEQALHDRAEGVSMSELEKGRIYQAISECSKEEYRMRIRGKRKMIVAVAAMCLLGTMVALGAGKVAYYSSSHNANEPDFASFADMGSAKEQTGFPVKAVEKFDNGFAFQNACVINVDAHDESGQTVDTFPELSVEYTKNGQRISLSIEKERPEYVESTTGNPVDIPYKDLTLTYRNDHYKFVPPDYEVTEEDQAAIDAGEMYLSYGSSEVELKDFHFVGWKEGEIRYSLMSYGDGALGQDEMVKMAQQIIDSPQL